MIAKEAQKTNKKRAFTLLGKVVILLLAVPSLSRCDRDSANKGVDVYIAGNIDISDNREGTLAVLGKNGETQWLDNDNNVSGAMSVYATDSHIYLAGLESGKLHPIVTVWKLPEWKQDAQRVADWRQKPRRMDFRSREDGNVQQLALTDGTTKATPYSIHVSYDDVYVAGRIENENGSNNAALWKNGESQSLDSASGDSIAFSVYVSNKDVYVAGYEKNEQGNSVAVIWKNGKAQQLSSGGNAVALSVCVSGKDVYAAGWETYQDKPVATLWKNGKAQHLGADISQATYVYVRWADVYVAGREQSNQGIDVATLWKNGKAQRLSDGNNKANANYVYAIGKDVYVAGTIDYKVLDENDSREPVTVETEVLWINGVEEQLNFRAGYRQATQGQNTNAFFIKPRK